MLNQHLVWSSAGMPASSTGRSSFVAPYFAQHDSATEPLGFTHPLSGSANILPFTPSSTLSIYSAQASTATKAAPCYLDRSGILRSSSLNDEASAAISTEEICTRLAVRRGDIEALEFGLLHGRTLREAVTLPPVMSLRQTHVGSGQSPNRAILIINMDEYDPEDLKAHVVKRVPFCAGNDSLHITLFSALRASVLCCDGFNDEEVGHLSSVMEEIAGDFTGLITFSPCSM